MTRHRSRRTLLAISAAILPGLLLSTPALGAAPNPSENGRCSSGVRTLSHLGDHAYPDVGNGGYVSLHTDVRLVYDAPTNTFLPGNHVVLTDRATQCLSDLSLDFERSSGVPGGPDMQVGSVTVNGRPAHFTFVQPTYPGDPHGQNDPDPRAHQASQLNPVGGPQNNPLPPACAPQLTASDPNAQNGEPCPANKLVITPSHPIRDGEVFAVTVNYTGRPGTHLDGDGTTDGWFLSDSPAGDGGFVTTEPLGSEDWMPLNNHPSAKPTYDFQDVVNAGKTVLANGELVSVTPRPPDAEFPSGSVRWHWHSPAPIASYLVEDSIGSYDLTRRTAAGGRTVYEAQGSSLSPAQKAANLAVMDQQADITSFQSQFNGRFPFTTDGVVVGVPSASFEEEMQTMITFQGGRISLRTFNHENMHQWWGDNVSESNFNMTFYKEGFATLGEYYFLARNAETAAGGPDTAAGRAAFQATLVNQFNTNYARTGTFWTEQPSDPTPFSLFDTPPTYIRPGTAYLALRQILGPDNFTDAMMSIQRRYGGRTITETQLEAVFHRFLPNHSAACSRRLDQFFTEWWDTPYAAGGGANRPQITGPGLAGPGFYDATCPAPSGDAALAQPATGTTAPLAPAAADAPERHRA